MAELIGLIASCITLAEVTTKTCLIARKYIHSDRAVSKELNALTEKISSYKSLIDLIKLQAEIDKNDAERLSALACVDGPLEASRAALRNLNLRLEQFPNNKILGNFVLGRVIDGKTAAQLKRFDNALPILQLALDSDQRVITSKVLEYTKNTSKDVSDVKDLLFQQRDERDAAAQASVRQEMKSWLDTFDPTIIYDRSRETQTSGSGRWFLDHEFSSWIQAEPAKRKKVLWLRGNSGTGKTILLSSAIDHLQNGIGLGVKDAVAYFYCSSSEMESQSAVNMMKSYIRQLFYQTIGAEDTVGPLYEKFRHENDRILSRALVMALRDLCSLNNRVVFFLDALNESEGAETGSFVDVISDFLSRIPNCQVMISCTESTDPFKSFEYFSLALVDMEQVRVNKDIASFVADKLNSEPSLCKFADDLKEHVQRKIELEAKGSFRWAECSLQSLRSAKSPLAAKIALDTMSPSLEGHYLQNLLNIPREDVPFVRAALLWLRFQVRPMSIEELREAMTLDTSHAVDLEERLFEGEAESILKRCGSLVSYDAQLQRVSLAHDSVRRFLLSKPPPGSEVEELFQDQDMDVNYLCCVMLDYLNMPCFASGACRDVSEADARWKHWPLLPYTSKALFELMNWRKHDLRPRLLAGLETLFAKSSTKTLKGNAWACAEAQLFETCPTLLSGPDATESAETRERLSMIRVHAVKAAHQHLSGKFERQVMISQLFANA